MNNHPDFFLALGSIQHPAILIEMLQQEGKFKIQHYRKASIKSCIKIFQERQTA